MYTDEMIKSTLPIGTDVIVYTVDGHTVRGKLQHVANGIVTIATVESKRALLSYVPTDDVSVISQIVRFPKKVITSRKVEHASTGNSKNHKG